METPRYIIVGFGDVDKDGGRTKDVTHVTHVDIANILLYFNSAVSPFERWNLNFLLGPLLLLLSVSFIFCDYPLIHET